MGIVKDVTDTASRVWNWLKPPRPGDPEADYHWRVKVVYSLLALAAVQVAHIFTTESWPWAGPTARAADTERIEQKLDALIEQQGKQYQLTLAREICRLYFARMEPAPSAFVAQTLENAYEEKQREYAALEAQLNGRREGRRYNVSECQRGL